MKLSILTYVMVARRADRLSIRLVAAGALLLLAFVPSVFSGRRSAARPVCGYGRITGIGGVTSAGDR